MVNILSSSAGEIISTVSEFASSASETASAVNETNATVQEVRQTTDLTSQKAKHVFESAQRSVTVAKTGKKSVDDAIGGMQGIQERMGFIADRIVKLSEQSQAIGDIIATVNDLAEQSNLLAVNAAIEAAKAGEHGKGFAVVAQEVKNLATQSKQATAQVRNILGEIQKATTAAVLATEQGSKAVETGVKQSGEAGEVIQFHPADRHLDPGTGDRHGPDRHRNPEHQRCEQPEPGRIATDRDRNQEHLRPESETPAAGEPLQGVMKTSWY